MTITIREVAAAAGVSVATASRALSGRRKVTPDAQEAVLAASERLGYRPNRVARSLRMRSTATVGMVVPGISNPYFPALVESVERELSSTGRELFLCDSQTDVGIEAKRVEALIDRRVDGLLFVPCDRKRSRETLERAASHVPVVQLDRYVDGAAIDFVGVDNTSGIGSAIAHLVEAGCRTFALVSSRTADSSARVRLAAYRQQVGAIDPGGVARTLLGDYSLEWGRAAAQQLLAGGELPDAVVCGADVIALGVIAGLTAGGASVPDDIMVTGFDDIGFAAVSSPPLTTLRQPDREIATLAVRMLDDRLAGAAGPPQSQVIPPLLVERRTTLTPSPVD
jgi:LacI family transcriptional regulator